MAQAHEAQFKWHCKHCNNTHISKVNNKNKNGTGDTVKMAL